MSAQTIKMTLQFRRDTTENWLLNQETIPAAGEPCYDLDAKTLKIGDGTSYYKDLPIIGGASISPDGKSLILEDGVFKLAGFDTAAPGTQPRKNEDGSIEWVVSSTESIEELQKTVGDLQVDVDAMKTILTPQGEGAKTLLERVETLETQVDTLDTQVEEINTTIEDVVKKTVTDEVTAQINDFATKVTDDETVNTFRELVDYVANHNGEVATLISDITTLQSLVGDISVEERINSSLTSTMEEIANTYTTKAEIKAIGQAIKYEVSSKPIGTLVKYGDEEIRVMCPADTKWAMQVSGEEADKNSYYIGFKAYAPDNAVSFKEDLAEIITDNTMYYFENNEFAGVDQYGRKYSIVWLPVANYQNDVWTYYGSMSSAKKYIGWYYSVEWYDADGIKIHSDCIRINLSNEECYSNPVPYYMSNVINEISVNGTLLDVVDGKVNITVENTTNLKTSEEITIAEDGTLGVGTINLDKIVQTEGTFIVLDGGGAV